MTSGRTGGLVTGLVSSSLLGDFWRDGGVIDAGEQEFEDAVFAGLVLILAIVEREMSLV